MMIGDHNVVTDEVSVLKKKILRPEFGPNRPKSGPE